MSIDRRELARLDAQYILEGYFLDTVAPATGATDKLNKLVRVRPVERTGELSITASPNALSVIDFFQRLRRIAYHRFANALSGIDLFPVTEGELSVFTKLYNRI